MTHLVKGTGLAASTVYRLVGELEDLGYLRKANDRKLISNFSFEQIMAVGGMDLQSLNAACRDVSSRLNAAFEFISLRRQNLF